MSTGTRKKSATSLFHGACTRNKEKLNAYMGGGFCVQRVHGCFILRKNAFRKTRKAFVFYDYSALSTASASSTGAEFA